MTDYTEPAVTESFVSTPAVRVHADYSSTDGRVPDSMYIEYADNPGPAAVRAAVHLLADVANQRDAVADGPIQDLKKLFPRAVDQT